MKTTHALGMAVGLAAMLASSAAMAQQRTYENQPYQDPTYYGQQQPTPMLPWGLAFTIGGGVTGFTSEVARDTTDVGGMWEARLVGGTRRIIGGEVAYVGTAQSVNAIGLDPDAVLLGSGVEGNLRVNFLTGALQPFVIAGAGWRHYDLVREDFNTSAVQDNDDVLVVPLGGGLAYRFSRLVLDIRGTVRPAFYSDLIATPGSSGPTVHTWDARLDIGWEF